MPLLLVIKEKVAGKRIKILSGRTELHLTLTPTLKNCVAHPDLGFTEHSSRLQVHSMWTWPTWWTLLARSVGRQALITSLQTCLGN